MNVRAVEEYVFGLLPKLGVNKQRELVRLVYEIAKRDGISLSEILPVQKNLNFESAKKQLLARRYPVNFKTAAKDRFYLPKLELNPALRADLTPRPFYPKTVYIETSVQDSELAARVRAAFPKAEFKETDGKTQVGSPNFSRRLDTLLIHREKYDFLKPCPCSCSAACCGYNLINLGFGCRFECEYCFLQQYQNLHAVLLPANLDEFLSKIDAAHFRKGPFDRPRIGSGEFTDSLVLSIRLKLQSKRSILRLLLRHVCRPPLRPHAPDTAWVFTLTLWLFMTAGKKIMPAPLNKWQMCCLKRRWLGSAWGLCVLAGNLKKCLKTDFLRTSF